jgi:hypothetical protein
MNNAKIALTRTQIEKIVGKDDPDAIRVFEALFDRLDNVIPKDFVYRQGPHDKSPQELWPWAEWEDVSYEEANLVQRVKGAMAGDKFAGTPARLSISVTGGVPTITVAAGGKGYLSGGSGNLTLIIAGDCTTPMLAHATVASGVLTGIVVDTAGAGYTSAIAVYDGVVAHGDTIMLHDHSAYDRCGFNGGPANISPFGGAQNDAGYSTLVSRTMARHTGSGTPRTGNETTGAYVSIIKWRRVK